MPGWSSPEDEDEMPLVAPRQATYYEWEDDQLDCLFAQCREAATYLLNFLSSRKHIQRAYDQQEKRNQL